MSQADQGISTDNLMDAPLKRKRGRPRKYPKLKLGDTVHIGKNRGKRYLETIPIPPGSGMNGNQSHPANPIQNAADEMLGQVVSGVIEAVFEAGYLLCVKVGNSGITLRGVVFKPGHYVPVSADNDVAPDVQMIRRNTFPSAAGNYTQSHGCNPRSKSSGAKRGSKHIPHHSLQEASKDKTISPLSTQITLSGSSRGNVVPVILQPAKLTNGSLVATESHAIQTTHMATSKGGEVLTGTLLSKESALPNVTVGTEKLPFQPQTSQQVLQDDASMDDSHHQSPADGVHVAEAKSMKLPSTPFENLVTEAIKRTQAPSLSPEVKTENNRAADKISAEESEDSLDIAANLVDVPLMIEPLKVVQPAPQDSSVSIPKALDASISGKMTELLQVLQENMMQNQEPWAEVQNLVPILKSNELGE